ncbi:MAG TPA: hypothetical protein VFY11_02030, partial [Nocardioidaceae bacterium]|nr:hypothetical protein [Nocardioidaceae bacterium]
MDRHRTMRPRLHAPALIGLAALPLALSGSQVEAQLAVSDAAAAPTTREVVASAPTDLAYPTTRPPAVAPAEHRVPARPGLGDARAGQIPWIALQAYRRAADILGEVDPSCGISWALLAAVGQVESEHGESGGGALGDDGVARPAIVTRGADAAVGPMQLVPDAWKMAGVDGDGDGTRSPQDLDDAAVAAGVYLCATGTDLRTPEGAEKALLAYNSSQRYVDEVLVVATRYDSGDYAVAEPPVPQTIGVLLDYGLGTPALEQPERMIGERPAGEDGQKVEERAYTARRSPQPDAERDKADDGERLELLPAAPSEPSEPSAPSSGPAVVESPEATASGTPEAGPTEPTAEPTLEPTAQPTAEPTAEPTGAASEIPTEGPSAGPSETSAPEPVTVQVTGVWSLCGESYCLDETQLDPAEAGEPTDPAAADFDGDGVVATVAEELEGLVGQTVELAVVEGSQPLVVV